MRPDRDLIVAIDIGGTKMAAGLMTLRGDLVDRTQVPVDHSLGEHELFESLAAIADQMMVRAVEHHQMVPVCVGVGSAGPLSLNAETVSPLNINAWREFPLRSLLAETTGLPVYGDLDAKSLALAEGWLGAAQGHSNFMAMVVSTGVGGGVILNGQLVDGATGNRFLNLGLGNGMFAAGGPMNFIGMSSLTLIDVDLDGDLDIYASFGDGASPAAVADRLMILN